MAVGVSVVSVILMAFWYVMMAYKRRMHPVYKRVVWVKRKATYKYKCCKKRPRSLEEWYLKQAKKVQEGRMAG